MHTFCGKCFIKQTKLFCIVYVTGVVTGYYGWQSCFNKIEKVDKIDKFAVAVIKNKKILDTFLLEKLGAFPKQFFTS